MQHALFCQFTNLYNVFYLANSDVAHVLLNSSCTNQLNANEPILSIHKEYSVFPVRTKSLAEMRWESALAGGDSLMLTCM